MTEEKKTAPVAKSASAAKPPRKLVPRRAPPAATETPVAPPAVEAAAPAPAKTAARPRKPSAVEATVARHQKVLAEALAAAQAINYDQPKVMKQEAPKHAKAAKPVKQKKAKLVRDSYAMPETEYARIAELKKRLAAAGTDFKKSELLRAGLAVLVALDDAGLMAAMGRVERIKTGRPAKEGKK